MRSRLFSIFLMSLGTATLGFTQEFNQIDYLCCDWGPALTRPANTNDAPRFNDTEEEVYFLKQLTQLRREKLLKPDLFTGSATRDVWTQRGLYLCKMKPDGSGKTELKELWRNPSYPIDTQAQTTWMDVNRKTKKIVVSIVIGGNEIVGLWTMNLDGSQLKRIQQPRAEEGGWSGFAHPSWTPDGQWIVFGKGILGPAGVGGGIAKCTAQGSNTLYLTKSPDDSMPCVSPDGKQIAFIHKVGHASRLYLMNSDGSEQYPLPNPDDKRWGTHGGFYPAWNPDGSRLFLMGISCGIIDARNGKKLIQQLGLCGWPHWGRRGLIGFNKGGILFTDIDHKESKWLASSGLTNVRDQKPSADRW